MIAAYGQDDRVCSYTALCGIFEINSPEKPLCVCWRTRKKSGAWAIPECNRDFLRIPLRVYWRWKNNYSDLSIRKAFSNSLCLSADVGAAADPNFKDVFEAQNAPKLNYGVLLTKYTGSRGKSGSNDASAETVGKIRRLFNDNGIVWQMGELGKVDAGGGGTVAQFVANLNIETIDCGVPLLSMHSPFEVAGKLDIYMAYKAYKSFLQNLF